MTETLANHYQADNFLYEPKLASFVGHSPRVITSYKLREKVFNDYELPFNNPKVTPYPNSNSWLGHDLDSNKIFTFDARSNKLRTIDLRPKHTLTLENNRIVLSANNGHKKVFKHLDSLHAYMSHHSMKKSQAKLLQTRTVAEDKKEEKEEKRPKKREEEPRSHKELNHLTPPPLLIHNYIKVLQAEIGVVELKHALKEFKFNNAFYLSLDKKARAHYRHALLINANHIQKANLEEKGSDQDNVIKPFLKMMSYFEMLYWAKNYISICDKTKKTILIYDIKDRLVQEYQFPFANAHVFAYPNSHFWLGYELDSKTIFTVDVSSKRQLRKIVLKEGYRIKLDSNNKIILYKMTDRYSDKEKIISIFKNIDDLHAYMSHRSMKKSQLKLISKQVLNLDAIIPEEKADRPHKSVYIHPPVLAINTLINSVLEVKTNEKELRDTLSTINHRKAFYLEHWNKKENDRDENALVAVNLLKAEKPDEKNRHQNNLRNLIISFMPNIRYKYTKPANIIRLMMILLLNRKQNKIIHLDFLKLFETGLIEDHLLDLTTISKRDQKEIQKYIKSSGATQQSIIFKQLLINANILSEESVNADNDLLVTWIIEACKQGILSNEPGKLDLMRLILQVTQKHNAIEAVDFTPFVLCGIFDKNDVQKLVANPGHQKPMVQQIFQIIETRNQAIFDLYQPLYDAGYITSDSGGEFAHHSFKLLELLCNGIHDYEIDKQIRSSEKEKIALRILPILKAMRCQSTIFENAYAFTRNYITNESYIKEFLANVVTVNAFWGRDSTPLTHAADHGHLEIVELLMEHGARLNFKNESEDPHDRDIIAAPMVSAARGGNLQIAKLFANGGVDVNQIARLGGTAIETAARNGDTEMMKFLLEQKDILLVQEYEANDNYESSALNSAMKKAHIDIINMLLARMLEKLNQGISLFPGMPMWLIKEVFSGLQELQSISFPDPGLFAVNLDLTLDPFKNSVINETIETILEMAKKLPVDIEEKDKPAITQQFQYIFWEKKIAIKYMMETIQEKSNANKLQELKTPAPATAHAKEAQLFMRLSMCIRRSLERAVSDDHQWAGKNENGFLVLQLTIDHLMQHEYTRYLLSEMLPDLFKNATQKNKLEIILYLLKTARMLHEGTAFYSKAIESAAFFGRPELLNDLLAITKEVDGKALLSNALSGLRALLAHINKGVQYHHFVHQYDDQGKNIPVKLNPVFLDQIGLVNMGDLSNPDVAKQVLLNNFEKVIKILFQTVVDRKSISSEQAALLAEYFPASYPLPGSNKKSSRPSAGGMFSGSHDSLPATLKSSVEALLNEGHNPYKILGVSPDAEYEVIKRAYRKKAVEVHPDKAGSEKTAIMKLVNRAFEVLRNVKARQYYDTEVARGRRPVAQFF